jgi:hypothetical protein
VTRGAAGAIAHFDRVTSLIDEATLLATDKPDALWESLDRAHGALNRLASVTAAGDDRNTLLEAGRRAQRSHDRLIQTIAGELERLRRAIARVGAGSAATACYGARPIRHRRLDRHA